MHISEDATAPVGFKVMDVIETIFAFSSGATAAGILVVLNPASLTGKGVWQYQAAGSTEWQPLATGEGFSNTTFLSLNAALRFVPDANYNGTAPELSVTGVDSRSGWTSAHDGTRVALASIGSPLAVSTSPANLTVNITAVNDAPTVKGDLAALPSVMVGDADPVGFLVGSLVAANFSDEADNDADTLAGIAVIGIDGDVSSQGVWQYWSTQAQNWVAIAGVTEKTALLLSADTIIRFAPDPFFTGVPAPLVIRLIDSSSGAVTVGHVVDLSAASAYGGTTAYSADTLLMKTGVADTNFIDNGHFSNGLTGWNHTGSASVITDGNSWVRVSADGVNAATLDAALGLTAGTLSALGGGNATTGSALVLNQTITTTQDSVLRIKWSFDFRDVSQAYPDFGFAVVNGHAYLLAQGADSDGVFTYIIPAGQTVTLALGSMNVGAAAPHSELSVYGVELIEQFPATPSNHAPILIGMEFALNAVELGAGAPSGPVGSLVSTLVGSTAASSSTVIDIDSEALTGIAVTGINTAKGTWWYSTDNGTTWTQLSDVSNSNALLLRSEDRLLFQGNSVGTIYNALTFHAWDQTSGSAGDRVDLSGTLSAYGAFSSDAGSATITVTPQTTPVTESLSLYVSDTFSDATLSSKWQVDTSSFPAVVSSGKTPAVAVEGGELKLSYRGILATAEEIPPASQPMGVTVSGRWHFTDQGADDALYICTRADAARSADTPNNFGEINNGVIVKLRGWTDSIVIGHSLNGTFTEDDSRSLAISANDVLSFIVHDDGTKVSVTVVNETTGSSVSFSTNVTGSFPNDYVALMNQENLVSYVDNLTITSGPTVYANTPYFGKLHATDDTTPQADLAFAVTTDPAHGIVVLQPNGTYVYLSSSNYSGADHFTYSVTDQDGKVSTATVDLFVQPHTILATHTTSVSGAFNNPLFTSTDLGDWTTTGSVTTQTGSITSGDTIDTSGYHAVLSSAAFQTAGDIATVETTTLGLRSGTLATMGGLSETQTITGVSAMIKSSFITVTNDSVLRFNWIYTQTDHDNPDYGFILVNGMPESFSLTSPGTDSMHGTFEAVLSAGTTVTLAVGVVNVGAVDSKTSLAVDNFTLSCLNGDPVILDLDGDGISLRSKADGVSFDMNADGVADTTGWVGKGDGLLAYDANHDGRITGAGELVSEYLAPGTPHSLAALATFDSNGDGRIDASDAAYADLLVWRDGNADGISEAGELSTLKDAGIAAISVVSRDASGSINGNRVLATSSMTMTDGQTRDVAAVSFDVNHTSSVRISTATNATPLNTAEAPHTTGTPPAGAVNYAALLQQGLNGTGATAAGGETAGGGMGTAGDHAVSDQDHTPVTTDPALDPHTPHTTTHA